MNRTVTASLEMTIEAPARLALQIGIASPDSYPADEIIEISLDGVEAPWCELAAAHGGRIWVFDSSPGQVRVNYQAFLAGQRPASPTTVADELCYLRPSRYCESDRLTALAARQFGHISEPRDLVKAVTAWVGTHLKYVAGSSGPSDGAIDTLLGALGVCRDFAHLAVALLRALEIPARVAAVYAPGLQPMDFHAVAEASVDGVWQVLDSTLLAPRQTLVRIATGRDAADTSFLSSYGGSVSLNAVTVTATVAGPLPKEDLDELVQLR